MKKTVKLEITLDIETLKEQFPESFFKNEDLLNQGEQGEQEFLENWANEIKETLNDTFDLDTDEVKALLNPQLTIE